MRIELCASETACHARGYGAGGSNQRVRSCSDDVLVHMEGLRGSDNKWSRDSGHLPFSMMRGDLPIPPTIYR